MKLQFRSNFIKSLAVLVSGSVVAQLIVILVSPFMTRLYSADQIGEYTLVLTAIGMFGSVICARYDMAIVSESDESNVVSLCVLSLLISIFSSVFVSIGYAIYYYFRGYSIKQIIFSCICIYVLLILTGISNILLSYNNRNREYKLITSVTLIRAIVKETLVVIGGILHFGSWILVLSEIFGTTTGIGRQSKSLRNSVGLSQLFRVDCASLKLIAKKHRRQALYSTPALFANNFSYSSINLFIDYLFGSSVLGFYAISYRLLGLPLTVISSNVSKVYFEESSRHVEKNGNYKSIFLRTSLILLLLAVPLTIILMFVSPWFCALFFGEQYYIAGIFLRYLAPMFGIRFIVSPLSVGMIVSQKQQYDFVFQVLFVIMSLISFGITSMLRLEIEQYLTIISCLYSIVYLVFYCVLFCFSKTQQERKT